MSRGRLGVAAAGAVIALAAAGCGSKAGGPAGGAARSSPQSAATVTLELKGGVGNAQLTACSLRHHYTVYRASQTIEFAGAVRPAPAGKWKLKAKTKKCTGGVFEPVSVLRLTGGSGGSFRGSFPAPGRGLFFVRAEFKGSATKFRSDKRFFEVR